MADRNKNRKNGLSDFLRYKRGEMKGEERNSFEREIQKDAFTEEASEGFESLSADETIIDLEKLHKRLNSRTSGKKRFFYFRIAASVAVIMIISSIFILIDRKESEDQLTVSDNKSTSFEIIINDPFTAPVAENIKKGEKIVFSDKEKSESVSAIAAAETRSEALVTDNKIFAKAEREDSLQLSRVRKADIQLAKDTQAAPLAVAKTKSSAPLQVQGKVIASDDNMPVPGANISLKGTTTGTITDASGNFSITLPDSAGRTLVASYIGMDSKEFDAKANSKVQVELDPSVSALSEVVVVGYGARKVEDEDATSGYVAPQPINGMPAFEKYVNENIQRPDTITSGQRIVVVLTFRVKTDGKIDSIKAVRSPGQLFTDEAIRLIKSGPQWKAAEQNGKITEDEVRVRIVFK